MSEQAPTTLSVQEQQVDLPIQSPEARNRALRQGEEAERARLIEKQLDTEALLSGLGAVGIGRLRHPFRNARILFTAARRYMRGEYNNPILTHPVKDPNPFNFDTDPLEEARTQRRREAHLAEQKKQRQAAEEARGPWENPFVDEEEEARWLEDRRAAEQREAERRLELQEGRWRNPFEDD